MKPNIVIFNPDQFRSDALAHLGNSAAVTPNLDAIVRTDAVSFRHAYCQNPVCTPSRCSFMSGWYPHVRGHRTMYHMMHDDEPVLLKTLKDNGYHVWWGGKNDLISAERSLAPYCHVKYKPTGNIRPGLNVDQRWRGPFEGDNFYSFYAGKLEAEAGEAYRDSDWAYVEGAVDYINAYDRDEPFCLYLPLLYPHPPYGVEEPWFSLIDRSKLPARKPTPQWDKKPSMLQGIYDNQRLQGWTEERFDELRAVYLGMCARIDRQFGMIVEALKASGRYDRTALFFFSDHGDFTGDYGLVEKNQNTFEDCLVRVPFIVKPPQGVPVVPGVRDDLVELVDFPATVEALADVSSGHSSFGRSLLPLMEGVQDVHRDAVFCEGGRLRGEEQCMEKGIAANNVPTGLYWPRVSLQQQEGPEHTKAVMCRTKDFKYVKRLYERDELYDLRADPEELHNLIDDPDLRDTLLMLKERLLDFYMETADVVPLQVDRRS